jgi:membrane associated rhomboid family serine protease
MISLDLPSRGARFMGLESRDYYRDGRYTDSLSSWGVAFTPVVKYLLILNVVVFLLQIFYTRTVVPQLPLLDAYERSLREADQDRPGDRKDKHRPNRKEREEAARKAREAMEEMMNQMPGMRVSVVQEWFELSPEKTIHQGQLWRLVTCAFCHNRSAIWHILFNMVLLYWFGTRLESMYGSREFLLFYLAAAISSSLAYVALAFYSGSNAAAIGASGAVMGVMVLYVIYYPFETFLLFWFIPVPLWVLLSIYVLYDLHPVLLLLAGDRVFTGVAHAGHLGGLAFGFLYWKLGLRLERVFGRKWKGARRWKPVPFREPVVLQHPACDQPADRDELGERVDAILKKISEQGQESLTDEERDVLIQASTKYRDKK